MKRTTSFRQSETMRSVALAYVFHVTIVVFGMAAPIGASSARLAMTHSWLDGLMQWDSQWFATIAKYGYQFPLAVQQQFAARGNVVPFHPTYRTAAFFPGLPLFIHLFTPVGTLIVIEVLFFVALSLMYRLVHEKHPRLAMGTIVLFAVNPCAVYFSALYTETLTLLGVLLIVTGLQQHRRTEYYVLSLIGVMLSTSVHDLGVFSLIYTLRFIRLRSYRKGFVFLCFGLIPPVLYETYLMAKFHTPFALLSAEDTWDRVWRWPLVNVLTAILHKIEPLDTVFILIACILVISQIVYLLQQDSSWSPKDPTDSLFSLETALWMAGILALSLCAYIPGDPTKSVLRFLSILWPACIPTYWNHLRASDRQWRVTFLIVVYAAYGTWGAAFFTHGWFFQ